MFGPASLRTGICFERVTPTIAGVVYAPFCARIVLILVCLLQINRDTELHSSEFSPGEVENQLCPSGALRAHGWRSDGFHVVIIRIVLSLTVKTVEGLRKLEDISGVCLPR